MKSASLTAILILYLAISSAMPLNVQRLNYSDDKIQMFLDDKIRYNYAPSNPTDLYDVLNGKKEINSKIESWFLNSVIRGPKCKSYRKKKLCHNFEKIREDVIRNKKRDNQTRG